MRIFRADVDVALGGAHGDAGNRHAFDHHEGVALHDHAIGEGAAVTLVSITDDEFLVRCGLRHGLPFDAGRETGSATAAQSRRRNVGEDRIRRHRQCALKAFVAVMGAVILDRTRIDDATSCEGQASLALQPGNFFGEAEPQRMRAIGGHGVEQGGHIRKTHRADMPRGLSRSPPQPSAPANQAA